MRYLLAIAAAAVCVVIQSGSASSQSARAKGDAALALLAQPRHHAIMRHALAPGIGDPSNFKIGDCQTQRNLSETGRIQARRLGEVIKSSRIRVDHILSSQWCRALETAKLLDLGPVKETEMLNSTFRQDQSLGRERADAMVRYLDKLPDGETAILVTHDVNIQALTRQSVGSGETLIVRIANGRLEVVGEYPQP